jgi:hypothetical protein
MKIKGPEHELDIDMDKCEDGDPCSYDHTCRIHKLVWVLQDRPPSTSHTRKDRVEMQGGIVHLPAEFREVARLANRAGLEGYEFVDAECGLDLDAIKALSERPAAEIEAALDHLPYPKSRIEITYRKPEAPRKTSLLDLVHITAGALRERAAYIVEHADAIHVQVRGSEGRWTTGSLADLPTGVALREAFRLLLRAEVPQQAPSPRFWCTTHDSGVCDGSDGDCVLVQSPGTVEDFG